MAHDALGVDPQQPIRRQRVSGPGIEVVHAVHAALVHVGQVVRDDVRLPTGGDGEVLMIFLRSIERH